MPITPVKDGAARVQPVASTCPVCGWSCDHGNIRREAKRHIRQTGHRVDVTTQRVETWRARWS